MEASASVKPVGSTRRALSLSRALLFALAGGVIAAALNILLLLAARDLLAIDMQIPLRPGGPLGPLGAGQVALMSVLPALGAGFLLWLLTRLTARALPVFLGIAAAFLLVSFLPLFTIPDWPAGVPAVLGAMHVGAAVPIVAALVKAAR